MSDILDLDFALPPAPAPSGNTGRFGGRWRLVGAGLSNVWRYGDLDLPAASGRLLLRGPNGTGKTTALEALWPYLLDLNGAKLAAGKARPTTLKLLMSEGAPAKGRRYGYLWLTFAAPADETAPNALDGATDDVVSFGVRLQYSPSSTPAVRVVPFTVPGRPLKNLALRGPHNSALEHEEFSDRVEAAGGRVFAEPDDYVEDLAARVWSTTSSELRLLASRLREVRNPTLLGDVSPVAAADALRQSLPGVAEDVLTATAEALAESDTTREAFERDEHAATLLEEFARVWTGHAVDVTRTAHTAARRAHDDASTRKHHVRQCTGLLETASAEAATAAGDVQRLEEAHQKAQAAVRAIETSDAYRSHGHVIDLRKRLHAEQRAATSSYDSLHTAAQQARTQTKTGQDALDDVIGDLAETAARAETAGSPPVALESMLAHHPRARVTRPVADRIADPGPGITLTHDHHGIDQLAHTWRARAHEHRSTADRATLVLRDYDPVATAEETAATADRTAAAAENAYDEASQAHDRATATARSTARQALAEVMRWAPEHAALRGLHDQAALHGDEATVWDADDVESLIHAEPAAVRDQLTIWADQALRIGETLAAGHESAAQHHLATAASLDATAAQHRTEARHLRSGRLLPLPRPAWAGPGEDDTALGSLLEWHPALDDADDHKALLELALASSGILGAHLHNGGATTHAWHISPAGAVQEHNLTAVLTIAPGHPHTDLVRTVLQRIALADTATTADRRDTLALVIGRDGTFTTGPLAADPATALREAGHQIPVASHIGARTRLARAQARADELDATAQELETSAAKERRLASERRRQRDALRAEGRSFPPRDELTTAEAERSRTAKTAHERHHTARTLRQRADDTAAEHARLRTAWQTRARSLSLPADPAGLAQLIDTSQASAGQLNSCATQLATRLLPRIQRIVQALPDEAALTERLAELQHTAQDMHTIVLETQAELTEAQSHGDADDAARRYEQATTRAKDLHQQFKHAAERALTAEKNLSTCESNLTAAQERLNESLPLQKTTQAHLTALLAWPPLAQALEADPRLASQDTDTADLLTSVETLLARRPTASKKTLGERYDAVRAELAQTWTIARDDPPAGIEQLDTFVLTHAETHHDPLSAAQRARALADRAKAALDAAEAAALRGFVIGRLPSAIGTAWAALTGWKKTVNRKMRAAQASSGVGVQVQIELRSDLDAATRTVHELSCKVGDALRTDTQKEEVGQALQSLLAAADGSTMKERLAAAVDIRNWVEVRYLVERPGPNGSPVTAQWGSRTGLSGGERRLVVLAPMLAAIAASYDRFPCTGLRLVPLDEVPAEVDERGREGLARYLAELDLDILCTSYLWDGAPGAWDGIDAHDLEAGADGTVVAFPMLIRTGQALPGDTDTEPGAGGAA
ncbi:SbcC/MukB-like Walker B domain-containing protein [Streptomyces sp. SAS_276]|uniref:SbcC/MukB-like Walker B domain-containing protein n=1 Tax=Streptomyces sp. SAS_276 TaxID=3412745 RepID=UPI00403C3BFC